MTKEARRREATRKRRRNFRIAKGAVIATGVAIAPLLVYIATRL